MQYLRKFMPPVMLFVLMVFLGSCNDDHAKLTAYTDLWDAIVNEGKIDLINSDNFTEDVVIITSPENIEGIEGFRAYYQQYLDGFSERQFTVTESLGDGNKIVKHWRFRGKHTGNFFGIPPTDREVDLKGVTIAVMEDGKIAQEQDFFDNAAFLQQLGIYSDPNNLAVIDDLYKNFAEGDIPAVLNALDAKVVWNEAEGNPLADGNPYVGPDAVLNGIFSRIGADYDYFRLKDIELHEMSGNRVLATLRYDAKTKQGGRLMDVQAAHLWTLEDGRVSAFQQYADTRQLAEVAR